MPIGSIEQDSDGARIDIVGQGKIGIAITLEIADRPRPGSATGPIALGGLECAIAIAQQDADSTAPVQAVPATGHGEIRDTITVEIPYGHEVGVGALVVSPVDLGGLE